MWLTSRDAPHAAGRHGKENPIRSNNFRTIEAMANVVENLGKLERRVTISLPKDTVQKEIDARIQKLAKNVRMPGFRPGKVPLKMVAQQYAGQVEAEVLSDKIGQEFFTISRAENLRVAGQPSFEPKQEQAEDDAFDATFEVYPEVKIGDLATAEVERSTTSIGDAEIDRTLDILRKQRVHYHARGEAGEHGDGGADTAAKNGDRDGRLRRQDRRRRVPGRQGRRLPVRARRRPHAAGIRNRGARPEGRRSATFDLKFPDDYHGKDVAGKTAIHGHDEEDRMAAPAGSRRRIRQVARHRRRRPDEDARRHQGKPRARSQASHAVDRQEPGDGRC
jgi:trigger factor